MNKILFYIMFILYMAIQATLSMSKLSSPRDWFNHWIFDKFFVFQFISVVIVGLVIESSYFHNLSYIRMGSRRTIGIKELSGYYSQGLTCLTILFVFIILEALFLGEHHFIGPLTEWFVRYLLGIMMFINIMSCLKFSNHLILRKYCKLITFIWMIFELMLFQPYIKKFYAFDVNLLFSWIFHEGTSSYYYMLILIIVTIFFNIKISDRRDFM